jgi:hypothetical protein
MTEREDGDGGAAFPHEAKTWDYDDREWRTQYVTPGMTLRDYFAAKAMQGFAAQGAFARDNGLTTADIVDDAYDIADAMLKARTK